jgi:hypothetical protein
MSSHVSTPDIGPIDVTKVLEKLKVARTIEDITGPKGAV